MWLLRQTLYNMVQPIMALDVAVILADKFVDKIVALSIFWLPQH